MKKNILFLGFMLFVNFLFAQNDTLYKLDLTNEFARIDSIRDAFTPAERERFRINNKYAIKNGHNSLYVSGISQFWAAHKERGIAESWVMYYSARDFYHLEGWIQNKSYVFESKNGPIFFVPKKIYHEVQWLISQKP